MDIGGGDPSSFPFFPRHLPRELAPLKLTLTRGN